MKYFVYYHVLLINNWKEIVIEQLTLMQRSGLYDKIDKIKIGCLGEPLDKLQELLKDYPKCNVAYYSKDIKEYEYVTLDLLLNDSKTEKPFFGLYFHTKGVSFPKISGGKYWRDYMGHYNITTWKEAVKKLQKGYDLCGVKLIGPNDPNHFPLHYSGNFFWFKSSYISRLKPSPNRSNRFNAEFWSCTGNPKAATLCQLFVDYDTKGTFEILKKTYGKNFVHTLAYNLPSEVEKATKILYSQNKPCDFAHYIIDLGFPLAEGGELPKDITKARLHNSMKLKDICRRYGSVYIQMPNIGVSQNWEQVWKHLDMKPKDVLIGLDPDERPMNQDWVYAMGEINRLDKIGLVGLMVEAHQNMIHRIQKKQFEYNKIKYYKFNQFLNWGLISMTGEWMQKMGKIPYPPNAKKYGWIEHEMIPYFDKLGYSWVILKDYIVGHTDYELNSPGSSQILRQWKNTIIFGIKEMNQYFGNQLSLEDYIQLRIDKKLPIEFNKWIK